jgi:hypothetical protein
MSTPQGHLSSALKTRHIVRFVMRWRTLTTGLTKIVTPPTSHGAGLTHRTTGPISQTKTFDGHQIGHRANAIAVRSISKTELTVLIVPPTTHGVVTHDRTAMQSTGGDQTRAARRGSIAPIHHRASVRIAHWPIFQRRISQERISQERISQERISQERISQGHISQGRITHGRITHGRIGRTDINTLLGVRHRTSIRLSDILDDNIRRRGGVRRRASIGRHRSIARRANIVQAGI